MSSKNPPQEPSTLDVPTIERELNELWAQMMEPSSGEAVMRACVASLLVYAPCERTVGEIGQVMAEVTDEHPSRVIIILVQSDAVRPPLQASVTIRCSFAERERKQICCEQIVIKVTTEEISRLPSFVRPLIVPDLPVFLWWRDVPNLQSALFTELVETSDRVIIDSAKLPETEDSFQSLGALIEERAQWTAFGDLNWCRLTPWRVLIAGFFDVPEYRSHLAHVDRVEINCVGGHSSDRAIPSQALLAAGWLASRLKWWPASKPHWINRHTCQWPLQSEERTIVIEIKISSSESDAPGRLDSVQLISRGELAARFLTFANPKGTHLKAEVSLGAKKLTGKIIQLDENDEAQLIRREVEILGHDAVYEEALAFLTGLQS